MESHIYIFFSLSTSANWTSWQPLVPPPCLLHTAKFVSYTWLLAFRMECGELCNTKAITSLGDVHYTHFGLQSSWIWKHGDMGNDPSIKLVDIMKEDLHQLHLQHPGLEILFWSLTQRCKWKAGAKLPKTKKMLGSVVAASVWIHGLSNFMWPHMCSQ